MPFNNKKNLYLIDTAISTPKATMTTVVTATVMPMLGPTFSMSVKKIPKSETSANTEYKQLIRREKYNVQQ